MQESNEYVEALSKTAEIIQENRKFIILTHEFPDGDSLGSQIALFELLKNLGKDVSMVCKSEVPYQYRFLPDINELKKDLLKAANPCSDGEYVFFCLDSADENRFNFDTGLLKEGASLIINIDHHPGNTMYGNINVVDYGKSATAEILYELINLKFKEILNYNIALGLYTGILTDTGRFQYENTTGNIHRIVSHLLEFGIVPSSVFSFIYENEPFNRFKLLEKVLKRIKIIKSKKLIYSYVLQQDFSNLRLPFSANDGIIEVLRTASEAKVAALFKQVGKNQFKVSLRSSDSNYSVKDIASEFGGGGHRLASAYSQKGTLKEVISKLVRVIN
ncbi:MAG: bifunctional oligoribonuclease/PAP phosphatase NrnA [Actinobacteria bacterium]|nr:bifunctional oligoribonuclease/PAP phosphatase NrnA [Actinomycetota bacterium]